MPSSMRMTHPSIQEFFGFYRSTHDERTLFPVHRVRQHSAAHDTRAILGNPDSRCPNINQP